MKARRLRLSDLEGHPELGHLYIHRGPIGSPDNQARRYMAIYLRQGKPPAEASRLARGRAYLDYRTWNPANLATPT